MEPDIPIHLTAMVRAWQCRKRGLCCRGQRVAIDEIERRRLERKLRELGDPLAPRFHAEAIERDGDWPLLPHQHGDRCVFLDDDNLCAIRKRFGEALYPQVCKKFPYLLIHTGERQVVDLSFQCPTALQLLAQEPVFEVLVEVGTEPPVDRVAWMGNEDRECRDLAGNPIPVGAFWELHWSLFERFFARPEGNPVARLVAFTEDVTGEEVPPPAILRRALLKQGAFEPSVERELVRLVGESPEGLPWLWTHLEPQSYTLDPLPEIDEEALVLRYVLHRFLCPVFYLTFADPRFLIATLFACLARYRIERERGFDPLAAVRNLDRLFVHNSNAAALIGSGSTFHAWRAMAALARAATVG